MSASSSRTSELKDRLQNWIVKSVNDAPNRSKGVSLGYSQLIDMLVPLANSLPQSEPHTNLPVMTSVSPTGSSSSLVISLSDQLEWQQGARTHSPRTPSAPEILRSLGKSSPPPSPSRWNDAVNASEGLSEADKSGGMEALEQLVKDFDIKSAVIRGDVLWFKDGASLPLGMVLPLKVRILERKDDSLDNAPIESTISLTVGSAWLSAVAEYTYDSPLAALLRARKGLSEIIVEDRRILNRFLLGSLSLNGLMSSSLWSDSAEGAVNEEGRGELAADSSDILSVRLKKQQQIDSLEERKLMLQDQQNRLRKLLARELQRMHSVKPAVAVVPAAASVVINRNGASEVSNVVANMLKRFKTPKSETPQEESPSPNLGFLQSKLRALKVEWYRVNEKLRSTIEAEQVLERKIKRLRCEATVP